MKKKRDRTKKPPTRSKARLRTKARSRHARRSEVGIDRENSMSGLVQDLSERLEVSPVDTGGDVDADWQRAQSSGEETVGGSVATPDQSVVDELARPLGVERPPDAPVITSDEILSARDRRRWRIEQHTEEQARDAGEA
jgi:Family of unknown function (DUF6335)